MIISELRPGRPDIVSAQVEPDEVKKIKELTNDVVPRMRRMSEAAFLDEMQERAGEAREKLPKITEFMDRMSSHRGPKVAVVKFPEDTVADAPPTPTRKLRAEELNLFPPDRYRGIVVAMGGWYGYGYEDQQNGLIHNNIIPTAELAKLSEQKGRIPYELGLHTEDAVFNLGEGKDASPDFITLHNMRNLDGVPTLVAMPNWNELSRETLDRLWDPWFNNPVNVSHGEDSYQRPPVSILYGPSDEPKIRLNTVDLNVKDYDPGQQAALRELLKHLEDRTVEIPLKPGEIGFVDNLRLPHGRAGYNPDQLPKGDGTDRWHRRLVVSTSAERIKPFEVEGRPRVVDLEKVIYQARAR